MKSLVLALLTTAALSAPALAAAPSTGSPMQSDSSASMQADSGMKANASISPSSLSKSQIRQVQQALNQKGFLSSTPDGVWGSRTKSALEKFQKSQNLHATGKLNQKTLSALNVQIGSMQQGRAATGTPPVQNNANGILNENNGAKSVTGNGMKPESGNSSH